MMNFKIAARFCFLMALLFSIALLCACGSDDSEEDPAPDGDSENAGDGDEYGGDDDSSELPDGDDDDDPIDVETVDGDSDSGYRTVDLVNPFIAAGGKGFGVGSGVPGATAPFGMVKVSPDTTGEGGAPYFYHCGGYYYDDEMIRGFSHVHLYGTGAPDLGNILFMPVNGPMDTTKIKESGYRSRFSKNNEEAHPGYYAVVLDSGIHVELTATERAAHHRYSYPDTGAAYLVIDNAHGAPSVEIDDGAIALLPDSSEAEGWALVHGSLSGRFGGLPVYWVARFNRPFVDHGTWNEGRAELLVGELSQSGADIGAYIGFDLSDGLPLEAQVGISFVSIEQARFNLETEMSDWDFDKTRIATEDKWEDEISVVRFEGGTEEERRIMATALYHSFMMPDLYSDANGKYPGFDGQIHEATDFRYYNDFSMWDTYRTQHPLLTLIAPQHSRDMMVSLIKMAEQGGYIPRWPMGIGYTNCMVGTSGDIVLADAYIKGVSDFDADFALDLMIETAMGPTEEGHRYSGREGIEHYLEYGYLPDDMHGGSVAKHLEHCVADYSISKLASSLGRSQESNEFLLRSGDYKNIWNEERKFFMARNQDGSWVEPMDPLVWEDYYTEGTAWQYLWLVPHDPAGLMALFESPEEMTAKLEEFFEEGKYEVENDPLQGLDPPSHYWHGNEPDLHAAYLFTQSGRPDLTQKWVSWISAALYSDQPDGIAGNDDCGTLSAWYVFSSMGFYPIAGSEVYLVGKPLFSRIEIELAGGKLIIEAPEVSAENIYVQSVTFNGEELSVPWLMHSDIAGGGKLVFEMGPLPSGWGVVGEGESPLP